MQSRILKKSLYVMSFLFLLTGCTEKNEKLAQVEEPGKVNESISEKNETAVEQNVETAVKKALSPTEEKSPEMEEDLLDIRKYCFQEILSKYKKAQDEKYSQEQVEELGLDTELVQYGWPYATGNDEVRYLYFDVDSDGNDELIITFYGSIIDIYGYDGEKARLAFSTPYRGIAQIFPDNMLRLDFSIAANYSSTTWYSFDTPLGDYFAVFENEYDKEFGEHYYTFCYYDLTEEEHKEIEKVYRESGYYPVWVHEWSDELYEDEYEDLIPMTDSVELPEGKLLSELELSEKGYMNTDLKGFFLDESGIKPDELVDFVQEDFDGDGKEEAFALTGKVGNDYSDQSLVEGAVWFVTERDVVKLHESTGMGTNNRIRRMNIGNTEYILFDDIFVTSQVTFVWSVSGSEAVEAPFSACGEIVINMDDGEGKFRIMDSSYDSMLDPEIGSPIGHTWKHYYFFYNGETGEIQEYAGTDIIREKVINLCDRDLVGELLPQKAKMNDLFCRGNGHIVMNYELTDNGLTSYHHYIYDFLKGHFVDDTGEETGEDPLDGIYRKTLCPQIANYPEIPD